MEFTNKRDLKVALHLAKAYKCLDKAVECLSNSSDKSLSKIKKNVTRRKRRKKR
jgi:hypothetical protein